MNGQPTAQNTRECGVDGEFPAMLNWENEEHVAKLASHWNVDIDDIPHHSSPTHVMQIMRYAEEGSVRFLWIAATNPAVTLPDLHRIRRILRQDSLFVVVSDAFLTETAKFADVVLPAALWGEKTGTFTNAERTVHISHQAVDPPGEARSDFEMMVDLARRLGLQDRDGAPLVKWATPEEAFDHFKELTRGRPCDYTGLGYDRLSSGSGIRWPCNERFPEGAPRLYEDHVFNTGADRCETYGRDLLTGASRTAEEYRARDPAGRACLEAADYLAPPEQPDDTYPLWLTTGRLVHHWHTRTKTGRAPRLQAAAPDGALEMNAEDLRRFGLSEGEVVRVESRRGHVEVPVRAGDVLPGHAFLPMHFGYWDEPGRPRDANELTQTLWDPVSKQPTFKAAAVRVRKAEVR
jgi:anaerobic selenocysteine-containing dehydrogenase